MPQALSKLHANVGDSLILVARNDEHLESIAADLKVRGAKSIHCINSDLAKTEKHPELLANIENHTSDISKYYFFYGVLPEQAQCEASWEQTLEVLNTNFTSKISLLALLANKIEQEQKQKPNRRLIGRR